MIAGLIAIGVILTYTIWFSLIYAAGEADKRIEAMEAEVKGLSEG